MKYPTRRIILPLSAVVLLAAMFSCSSGNNKKAADKSGAVSQGDSKQAGGPTFSVPDLEGKIHDYSEYRGKSPLVINFWGTWCPPCRMELPDLKKVYAEYNPKGLVIVSLAVKDTPERVREFASKNEMNWVMLMGDIPTLVSFGATSGVPTTIFIDRNGEEKGRLIGASNYDQFKREISKIM
jgi:thiol-disulfide isomerase/thioredoxin